MRLDLITAFIIVAALTLASSVATRFAERITDRKRRRRVSFWCQIVNAFLTVALVVTALFVQRTAQQATGERLAGSQSEILAKQERVLTQQETALTQQETALTQQETTLSKLDRSLEQATSLGEQQKEQTAALEQQQENLQEVLASQAGEIKLLSQLPLNRNLEGLEISYTPSPQKWNQIKAVYSKIPSPQPDLEYVDAPMKAENKGDHWNIDFDPAEVIGVQPNGQRGPLGMKKFVKLTTKENPLFEEVLQQALFTLRIRWGNGTSTVLDPDQKYYPSAMYVSRNEIRFILHPSLVAWNLNEIDGNAEIMFFGPNEPPENFRIHSLDPGVILDQTIQLIWLTRPWSRPITYDEQRYRKCSGPHTLFVQFDEFDPFSGKRYFRRANKPKHKSKSCVFINS